MIVSLEHKDVKDKSPEPEGNITKLLHLCKCLIIKKFAINFLLINHLIDCTVCINLIMMANCSVFRVSHETTAGMLHDSCRMISILAQNHYVLDTF